MDSKHFFNWFVQVKTQQSTTFVWATGNQIIFFWVMQILVFELINSELQVTIMFPRVFIDTLRVRAKTLIITNNPSRLFCFPVTQQSV